MKPIRFFAVFLIVFLLLSFINTLNLRTAEAYESQIDLWWPVDKAAISGTQPFKGLVQNYSLGDYKLYWQVDNGQWNLMSDNYQDYPHKEVSVDVGGWTWKGAGPYRINFIAQNMAGYIISQRSVDIYVNGKSEAKSSVAVSSTKIAEAESLYSPVSLVSQDIKVEVKASAYDGGNPFAGRTLHVSSYSTVRNRANEIRSYMPYEASLLDKIGARPTAVWLGEWSGDVSSAVRNVVNEARSSANSLPVFIVYNIPGRDCGSYSAGGASGEDHYKNWIRGIADGVGDYTAVMILEPDALAGMSCLSDAGRKSRVLLLNQAIDIFNSKPNISVYLDAGNPNWVPADEMASRLGSAGVDKARGFALNVSIFFTTEENISYGNKISGMTGGKTYVIDTSRNGRGSNGEWCNPWGRALGNPPTANTGSGLVDAFLWMKVPGESDGPCNGGPSAGTFWLEYALDIARNASW